MCSGVEDPGGRWPSWRLVQAGTMRRQPWELWEGGGRGTWGGFWEGGVLRSSRERYSRRKEQPACLGWGGAPDQVRAAAGVGSIMLGV